ncbi:hypothetical protein SEUCBS139899_005619 [Sporothrix eucalyptigena]
MGLINIQSQDCRDLLDIIDNLRSQGLDRYVPLPEIIVCGDQSSGKSSVLEAISGLSFPSKDCLCTRFATELVLRRDAAVSISVSIVPHHSRTDVEKQLLLAFHADLDAEEPDIGPVIEAAKTAMGLVDGDVVGGRQFSNDVLRIEMSGPKQQHLTLVDLPGLFHSGSATQSVNEAPVVRELVLEYMKRPRSIILAVVSGAYEFANQLVTQLAREVDARGVRTMGLITKPDKLEEGSERENAFLTMAANRDVVLQLGWHVLRNRGHSTRNATPKERDANEKEFFTKSGSPWLALPPDHLGINSLRPRLSTILMDQILAQLGPILEDVEKQMKECKLGLERLGTPRETVLEQRQYLTRVSSQFTDLVTAAVQGSYSNTSFFGSVLTGDSLDSKADNCYHRRLRAVTQNRLAQFAKEMHDRGRTRAILGDHFDKDKLGKGEIRRTDYIDEVKDVIVNSRGRELPGTFNPLVVSDLFRDQCRKWGGLASTCVDSIVGSAFWLISDALDHIAVKDTADKIMRFSINPKMAEFKEEMLHQMQTILEQHDKGHPITYNHYLTTNVQKARNDRQKERLRLAIGSFVGSHLTQESVTTIVKRLVPDIEEDMVRVAASDAIDFMEAYYKVALKSFVDNVSVLVAELCLVSKLPSLFTPDMVYSISDKDIAQLAGEQEHATAERHKLMEKKTCLQKCETELRRLDKHRGTGVENCTSGAKAKGQEIIILKPGTE